MKLVVFLSAVLFSAIPLPAAVSFIIQADRLDDANGLPLDGHGLWLLVASTQDASFAIDGLDGVSDQIVAGASTTLGSIIGGSDDMVVVRGDNVFGSYFEDGALDAATFPLNYQAAVYGGADSKWGPGDPLALLWFPTLTPASTTISEGTDYGFYTSPVAKDGSAPWVSPPDPTSNRTLAFYTTDGETFSPGITASNPAAAGNASLEVIPEPSTLLLAALAMPACLLRRIRRR